MTDSKRLTLAQFAKLIRGGNGPAPWLPQFDPKTITDKEIIVLYKRYLREGDRGPS